MKLYFAPGTCAIGIHVLMEEIGLTYEVQKVDFAANEQSGDAFLSLNRKGKVPVLQRDDGSLLTEFQAIAVWLARTFPDMNLFPDDPEIQARILEVMDYVVGTVHMQGFSRIMRPGSFSPNQTDHEDVRARGLEIFNKGLSQLDRQMTQRIHVVDSPSIADRALFYVEFWAVERLGQALPPNLAEHYERMASRAAVQTALKANGYARRSSLSATG
ncbi:glutathione S-transferase family protein [Bradyrhizobium lablabi]|uniref:glutathione S-transferase family protein n=1 Tax=Bradyrhizobium lablabi TaxID=722472 RepID=UPI00090A4535|nr:glutathione S-transferase N-terminal domain-containing protein [Bradyrhizobium lablabi]SHM82003.1 glutathione S-transferase [Bradyrhizobium lablabi]